MLNCNKPTYRVFVGLLMGASVLGVVIKFNQTLIEISWLMFGNVVCGM